MKHLITQLLSSVTRGSDHKIILIIRNVIHSYCLCFANYIYNKYPDHVCLCLWDLFPLAFIPQITVPIVTSTDGKLIQLKLSTKYKQTNHCTDNYYTLYVINLLV